MSDDNFNRILGYKDRLIERACEEGKRIRAERDKLLVLVGELVAAIDSLGPSNRQQLKALREGRAALAAREAEETKDG